MHKVAHRIKVIYDWVSGPAMSDRERKAHQIAEANPCTNTRLLI